MATKSVPLLFCLDVYPSSNQLR